PADLARIEILAGQYQELLDLRLRAIAWKVDYRTYLAGYLRLLHAELRPKDEIGIHNLDSRLDCSLHGRNEAHGIERDDHKGVELVKRRCVLDLTELLRR